MQSQYLDNVMHGLENDPVEEALERNPFYLTSSKYSLQLEQYAEHFSTDRILVIRSDDLKRDREKTMSSVYAFLGIDPTWRAPVLSQEFLQMRNRRAPLPVFRGFWKSAFRRRLGPYLPRMLKDRLLHVTSRPVDTGAASISPTFRRHLEVLLKDEVKGLYAFMDERFDGWGIA
jgi:hypothetical protein